MKTNGLIVQENGSMTNMAHFDPKSREVCSQHGATCERIVTMEVTVKDVKEKVGEIDKKQDRFFWTLFLGLAGIVVTLFMTIINLTMNQNMLAILKNLMNH